MLVLLAGSENRSQKHTQLVPAFNNNGNSNNDNSGLLERPLGNRSQWRTVHTQVKTASKGNFNIHTRLSSNI